MASVYPGDPKTPHAIKEALLDHVEPPRIGTPKNSTLNIKLTSDIRFWAHIHSGVSTYSSYSSMGFQLLFFTFGTIGNGIFVAYCFAHFSSIQKLYFV